MLPVQIKRLTDFCSKNEIDPQEIDSHISFEENMNHLNSFVSHLVTEIEEIPRDDSIAPFLNPLTGSEEEIGKYHFRKVMFSSKRLNHATPFDLFNQLDEEFHFKCDVCADRSNGKTGYILDNQGVWFSWKDLSPCWMNPPYGRQITKWLDKAENEMVNNNVLTVALLPARTDTNWFWNYCIDKEIRLIKGRVKFSGMETGAPFPSIIVIFNPKPLSTIS